MPLCSVENMGEESYQGSLDFSAGEAHGKEPSSSFLFLLMPLS